MVNWKSWFISSAAARLGAMPHSLLVETWYQLIIRCPVETEILRARLDSYYW